MLRKFLPVAQLAVIAAIIGSDVLVSSHRAAQLAVAQKALETAQAGVKVAFQQAEDATLFAAQATDSARLYRAQRDSLNRRAHSLETRVAELRGSFHEAAAVAPDTCKRVVAAASLAIDSLTALAATETSRADKATKADSLTHLALDSTQTALRSTRLSLGELGKAADQLEHASRPSLLSRLLPRPGYGATAGIDAFGKPNAVVGFTLSWSF